MTLSLPSWAREAEALAFAHEKAEWIREALARMPAVRVVGPGADLPVEGRELAIRSGAGRVVRIEGGSLIVPGNPGRVGARVAAFLKVLARERLQAACGTHAGRIGREYTRLTLRDTRSRWGSCAPGGALMFSWRLIMAPPEVLDYVAAHEVAHLEEMNHSPAFWAVVRRLMPDYEAPRRWLKGHGHELHAVSFGD